MSKAGKPITEDKRKEYLQDKSDFDRDTRCGGIFDNVSLKRLGYVPDPYATAGYEESEGLWVQNGLVKGRPQPILSAINNLDETTEKDIIGSEEDSKYPGE